MADVLILFHGGPCDGTNRNITEAQFAVGAVTCQGTTYVFDQLATQNSELKVFSTASTMKAEAKAARSVDPTAVAGAWSRLTRALAHTAPHHIRRQHAANARLRRVAR